MNLLDSLKVLREFNIGGGDTINMPSPLLGNIVNNPSTMSNQGFDVIDNRSTLQGNSMLSRKKKLKGKIKLRGEYEH